MRTPHALAPFPAICLYLFCSSRWIACIDCLYRLLHLVNAYHLKHSMTFKTYNANINTFPPDFMAHPWLIIEFYLFMSYFVKVTIDCN